MYKKTIQMIEQMLKEKIFPGACYSIITPNDEYDFVLGNAQTTPYVEPMKVSLLFDVASLTKVICTTTVVLQLMEQEKINIDASLSTYLPEFQDQKITIRHLLTHTADIDSYIKDRSLLSKEALRQAYYTVLSGNKLGEKVQYTDTGTILLGFMLEKILKKNVVDIFRADVLAPLQMASSQFLPCKSSYIVPTENHSTRGLIRGETHDPKAFVLAEHAGNAGLFTNLKDTKKFVKMYLNNGVYETNRLLKKETIQLLLTDQTPNKKGNRSLGWDLKKDGSGQSVLFHTGYTGTFLIIDPIGQEAMIFLSNRIHPIDKKDEYIEKRDQLIAMYLQEKAK